MKTKPRQEKAVGGGGDGTGDGDGTTRQDKTKQTKTKYKPQTKAIVTKDVSRRKFQQLAVHKKAKEITKEHILYMQPAENAIFQMSSAQDGLFAALNLFNNIKQEHLTI